MADKPAEIFCEDCHEKLTYPEVLDRTLHVCATGLDDGFSTRSLYFVEPPEKDLDQIEKEG